MKLRTVIELLVIGLIVNFAASLLWFFCEAKIRHLKERSPKLAYTLVPFVLGLAVLIILLVAWLPNIEIRFESATVVTTPTSAIPFWKAVLVPLPTLAIGLLLLVRPPAGQVTQSLMIPFNMATLMTGTLGIYKAMHRSAADMPASPGLAAAICAVLAMHPLANLLILRPATLQHRVNRHVRIGLVLCLTVACTGLAFAFWAE